jgi:hypothetical protein
MRKCRSETQSLVLPSYRHREKDAVVVEFNSEVMANTGAEAEAEAFPDAALGCAAKMKMEDSMG